MNYSFACAFMETDQQKISKLRMDFVALECLYMMIQLWEWKIERGWKTKNMKTGTV